MPAAMENFCFIDLSSSRTCIDGIYSEDLTKCQQALKTLKNAVIGSNRQKSEVLALGIVPRLISLFCDEAKPLQLRLDAAIIIGSLARGTKDHVNSLIYYGIVDLFLAMAIAQNTPRALVEACLCALHSIMKYPFAPFELIHSNSETISRLIQVATPDSSLQCQSYVTHILIPLRHRTEQMNLFNAGALRFLARNLTSGQPILAIPALNCLSSMTFDNKSISDVVCAMEFEGRLVLDIITAMLSRTQKVEIQLAASRLLSNLYRAGSILPNDTLILNKSVSCLARLCSPQYDCVTRAEAADTLAYLIEVDTDLQRLASISDHLLNSLLNLTGSSSPEARQSGFKCFASLTANDENIRKRIIEMDGLMEKILSGIKDDSFEIRLAAVRCLHSLSRSVQLLRTTFQDHLIWRPLMELMGDSSSSELLTVAASTTCNLLLEFSPAKEPMLESGALEILSRLIQSPEPALRLNGSWALMNMAFQADQNVKNRIISCIGIDKLLQMLEDSDIKVVMKTLGLLRNLLSSTPHIESIMGEHGSDLMKAINLVLDGAYPPDVKEQALCIVGNIAAGGSEHNYVLEDVFLLKKINRMMNDKDQKVQNGALYVVGNLLHRVESVGKLKEYGIITELEDLLKSPHTDVQIYENIKQAISKLEHSRK